MTRREQITRSVEWAVKRAVGNPPKPLDEIVAFATDQIMGLGEVALTASREEAKGYQRHLRECEQIAGKALGYPWFKDDQENFPGATEVDGVCVGDHVGDSIVDELAKAFTASQAEVERLTRERDALKLQAQCWAMEARGQKATVQEAYQAVTGATGEPGDWNGARPIRDALQAAEARATRAEALVEEAGEVLAEIANMGLGRFGYRPKEHARAFLDKLKSADTPSGVTATDTGRNT